MCVEVLVVHADRRSSLISYRITWRWTTQYTYAVLYLIDKCSSIQRKINNMYSPNAPLVIAATVAIEEDYCRQRAREKKKYKRTFDSNSKEKRINKTNVCERSNMGKGCTKFITHVCIALMVLFRKKRSIRM